MTQFDNKILASFPIKNGVRMRGKDITRLETLVDAAFAFAITMLVIAGDSIPTNYQALIASLSDIPSFAASIIMILFIWYGHIQWSRRYGLEDFKSIMLSGLLILVILIFVYPLKLVFAAMFSFFSGGYLKSAFTITNANELVGLFTFYGLGLAITCWVIAALFTHALRQRENLTLNEREIFETEVSIKYWLIISLPALLSAFMALFFPLKFAIWSGFIFWAYPILSPLYSRYIIKQRQQLFPDDEK